MATTSNHTSTKTSSEQYKLLVIKEDDLQEVSSFSFTWTKLYLAIIGVLLLLITLISLLICFTPLRQLVPGYGLPESNPAYIELSQKIQDLEQQIEAQNVYTQGFKNMIDNVEKDPDFVPSSINETPTTIQVQKENINTLHHKYLLSPVKGTVSHPFDREDSHFGIDIVAPKNSPIVATLGGRIIQSDWSLNDGNVISILHQDNLISIYKHNSVLLKEVGEQVEAGEAIAIIGNSGEQSDGPHLHFEIWFEGQAMDPDLFIHF